MSRTVKPVETLDVEQVCRMFGLNKVWVAAQVALGRLPRPERIGVRRCWRADQLWRAIAAVNPRAAGRAPLRYWPSLVETPGHSMRQIPGAMVQDWYVGQVTLRVVWPLPGLAEPSLKTAAGLRPVVDRLLKVSVEIGLYGPVLIAYDRHGKPDERAGGEEDWAVYADTIGGTAPHWPYTLSPPAVMERWEPGIPVAEVAATPEVDITPLLQLAAALPDASPAQRTLINLARTIQSRATDSARNDLEIFAGEERFRAVAPAVSPMPVPDAETDDLPEDIRRAGWLEVLSRRDDLAAAAIHRLRVWDGGEALPFSKYETIDLRDPHSKEWAARLRPVDQPTVAFDVVRVNERGGRIPHRPRD